MCLGCLCCRQDLMLSVCLSLSITPRSRGFLGSGGCWRGDGEVMDVWGGDGTGGCLGRVSVVVDSVGHICFSCSGAAQTQQVRAGPTAGTQGRVWMDTPVGRSRSRGTFQPPQPLSLPSVRRSQLQPQPRRLHLSPHQPGCSSSERNQFHCTQKEASDSQLRGKIPPGAGTCADLAINRRLQMSNAYFIVLWYIFTQQLG